MPNAKVTGAVVSHIWDDESQTDFHISVGVDDEFGMYVDLKCNGAAIGLRPESWPLIKEQIQGLFDEYEEEDGKT